GWLALATASDVCGDVSIAHDYDPANFSDDCGATGSQVVTFTATDDCGLTSTCTAQVIIVDTTVPVCMTADITLDTVIDPLTGVIVIDPAWIDAGSFDACGDVTLSVFPESLACENEGANLVTLTVTDECGNTSTCTAVITLDCRSEERRVGKEA